MAAVHRDIKLENVLLSASPSPLRLIDMGSCALVDGCSAIDTMLGQCTGLDEARSPVTLLYAPPERFISPTEPWTFDVFCAGLCALRLAWGSLETDSQLSDFREELAAAASAADSRTTAGEACLAD